MDTWLCTMLPKKVAQDLLGYLAFTVRHGCCKTNNKYFNYIINFEFEDIPGVGKISNQVQRLYGLRIWEWKVEDSFED